jgi:hypothetical protein
MATLTVTFTRAVLRGSVAPPLAVGRQCRAEHVTLGTTDSTSGLLTAGDGENVVELVTEADCYEEIGESPDATTDAATGDDSFASRLLKANVAREFWVEPGDKVAGIEA